MGILHSYRRINIASKARIMSILQKKLKLPNDFVKIENGEKVLFLNPGAPDWIVVSKKRSCHPSAM